jgi:hypothetical protein
MTNMTGLDLVEMNPTTVPFTFKNSGLITIGKQNYISFQNVDKYTV